MDKDTSLSTSPQLEVREQNGVVVALSQKQIISLFKKSEASGIPFDTLKEVYERGFTSELTEQAAFNRVNSFIAGGAARQMDKDLDEGSKYVIFKKTSAGTGGHQLPNVTFDKKDDAHAHAKKLSLADYEVRKGWAGGTIKSRAEKAKNIGVKEDKDLIEKRGLWDNIHAKRERIKSGSDEKMRKPGSKGAPTAQAFKDAAEGYTGAEKTTSDMTKPASRFVGTTELTNTYKDMTPGQSVKDIIKKVVKEQLEEAATDDAKGYKSSTGGLTQKGRDHYNRTTGSHLQAPVTTKPSKLKKGSKAANRRKSFCARMGGMKKRLTGSETANDPDSRINKALRKWNC